MRAVEKKRIVWLVERVKGDLGWNVPGGVRALYCRGQRQARPVFLPVGNCESVTGCACHPETT